MPNTNIKTLSLILVQLVRWLNYSRSVTRTRAQIVHFSRILSALHSGRITSLQQSKKERARERATNALKDCSSLNTSSSHYNKQILILQHADFNCWKSRLTFSRVSETFSLYAHFMCSFLMGPFYFITWNACTYAMRSHVLYLTNRKYDFIKLLHRCAAMDICLFFFFCTLSDLKHFFWCVREWTASSATMRSSIQDFTVFAFRMLCIPFHIRFSAMQTRRFWRTINHKSPFFFLSPVIPFGCDEFCRFYWLFFGDSIKLLITFRKNWSFDRILINF